MVCLGVLASYPFYGNYGRIRRGGGDNDGKTTTTTTRRHCMLWPTTLSSILWFRFRSLLRQPTSLKAVQTALKRIARISNTNAKRKWPKRWMEIEWRFWWIFDQKNHIFKSRRLQMRKYDHKYDANFIFLFFALHFVVCSWVWLSQSWVVVVSSISKMNRNATFSIPKKRWNASDEEICWRLIF